MGGNPWGSLLSGSARFTNGKSSGAPPTISHGGGQLGPLKILRMVNPELGVSGVGAKIIQMNSAGNLKKM